MFIIAFCGFVLQDYEIKEVYSQSKLSHKAPWNILGDGLLVQYDYPRKLV